MRDSYVKYKKRLREKRSGDAAKVVKKYKYADQLGFLDIHTEERRLGLVSRFNA